MQTQTRCAICSAQPRTRHQPRACAAQMQTQTRCANCPPQVRTRKEPRACETRGRKRHGARLARRSRACVRDTGRKKTQCATCPPQVQEPCVGAQPERTACVRDTGKKKTRCANCPAQPRVRARRGEERDTVRDLLAAGARLARRRRYLRAFVKSTPPP